MAYGWVRYRVRKWFGRKPSGRILMNGRPGPAVFLNKQLMGHSKGVRLYIVPFNKLETKTASGSMSNSREVMGRFAASRITVQGADLMARGIGAVHVQTPSKPGIVRLRALHEVGRDRSFPRRGFAFFLHSLSGFAQVIYAF